MLTHAHVWLSTDAQVHSLTLQYLEQMVIADSRHRSSASQPPSVRMMGEACRQLGLSAAHEDTRLELAHTLLLMRQQRTLMQY